MTPTARGDVSRLPLDPDVDPNPGSRGAPESRRTRPNRNRTVVLALACGGALGAGTRYAVSSAVPVVGGQFPWATFAINVTGSAALGFLLVLLLERFPRGRLARPVLGTGFLGAYTTFSTFMVDAVQLVRDGNAETAIAYVVTSLLAGLVAAWLGMVSARVAMRLERRLQAGER
jgi:fluoride exporter